jgi:hypothetical protein
MKKGLLTLLLLVLGTSLSLAQKSAGIATWNYSAYPDLPFKLNHITLDLNIDPTAPLIKGTGTYELTARRPDVISVTFNTADLDVSTVMEGDDELNFHIASDSLIIELADTVSLGEKLRLTIEWSSDSPYGVHTDIYGNLWTSLNPGSHDHWLPIFDHPEVAATLDASLTIPADKNAVINGSLKGDEVVSAAEKTVRWTSNTPIPASGLTIAVGDFVLDNARSGVKSVSLYVPKNMLLPEVRSGLLKEAVSTLKGMETKLRFEFPYESLNIVVLPDHQWEEIQSGAGIIYVYANLGSLPTQIKRGIAEQWFGNYQRYLDAPDNKYEFLKILLTDSDETQQLLNADGLQSIHKWNIWEEGLKYLNSPFLENTIKESLPELVKRFKGVTDWDEYADLWYDKTGVFWGDLPPAPKAQTDSDSDISYQVDYDYDEVNSSLKLRFKALGKPVETLIGVKAVEYGFTDTTRTEFSFTGQSDTISISISPGIDYLTLSPVAEQKVDLKQHKPFMFLIKQLRSSDTSLREQAAKGLQNYADKPDIQLAIRDVLKTEENAEVKAALLETLAEIIQGATGTEQTFLGVLNSKEPEIRLAALRALSHYPRNENVAYAVRNVLLKANSDTVFTIALSTYQKIAETGDLVSLAQRLEKAEDADQKALQVTSVAAADDTTHQILSIADRYALGRFPYALRKQALKVLIEYEQSADYWNQTLPLLAGDRDPRIRYLALDAIKFLSPKTMVKMLKARNKEEMDPRVSAKIQGIINRTKK